MRDADAGYEWLDRHAAFLPWSIQSADFEFHDSLKSTAQLEPVKRLCYELIVDAINLYRGQRACYTGSKPGSRQRIVRECELWFRGKTEAFFTFKLCCEQLGINHEAAKRAILDGPPRL